MKIFISTVCSVVLLFFAFTANAHFVKTPPGGINFKVLETPDKKDLWFAERIMKLDEFKSSSYTLINDFLKAQINEPFTNGKNDYVYVAKVVCKIKNTPAFFNKDEYMTLGYHQKSMPTVTLTPLNEKPFRMNASANLYGLINLSAQIQPMYFAEDEIKPTHAGLILGITPVEQKPKAVTIRMTGAFNSFLNRLVITSVFYELNQNELLAVTHVAASVEPGVVSSSEIFKGKLSEFFKKTMVDGMASLAL